MGYADRVDALIGEAAARDIPVYIYGSNPQMAGGTATGFLPSTSSTRRVSRKRTAAPGGRASTARSSWPTIGSDSGTSTLPGRPSPAFSTTARSSATRSPRTSWKTTGICLSALATAAAALLGSVRPGRSRSDAGLRAAAAQRRGRRHASRLYLRPRRDGCQPPAVGQEPDVRGIDRRALVEQPSGSAPRSTGGGTGGPCRCVAYDPCGTGREVPDYVQGRSLSAALPGAQPPVADAAVEWTGINYVAHAALLAEPLPAWLREVTTREEGLADLADSVRCIITPAPDVGAWPGLATVRRPVGFQDPARRQTGPGSLGGPRCLPLQLARQRACR